MKETLLANGMAHSLPQSGHMLALQPCTLAAPGGQCLKISVNALRETKIQLALRGGRLLGRSNVPRGEYNFDLKYSLLGAHGGLVRLTNSLLKLPFPVLDLTGSLCSWHGGLGGRSVFSPFLALPELHSQPFTDEGSKPLTAFPTPQCSH